MALKQYGYQKPNVLKDRQAKAKERMEGKSLPKGWSASRPVIPQQDSTFIEAMGLVDSAFRGKTMWTRADQTGLSVSTLSRHRQLKTQYPRLVSVQMQLAAIGYELVIRKKSRN